MAVVLALAALYVITARLGLMLALPPENKATAVWPPSGIALAALLLFGHRIWPGVWLGSFLANLWDGFNAVSTFPLSAHLFVSASIATGSTLQASAGSFLIRRWTGSVRPFQQATHAFTFAGVAMFVCLIASTLGVASLYLGGFAPAKTLPFSWWTWWLGDVTGVLTVGAFLLAWSRRPSCDRHPRRLAEAALLLLLLSALACVIFGIVSLIVRLPTPLAYLVIPVLVWATFRFGLHGATTALVLVSALAVVGTAQGTGPFAQPTVETSLLLLQVFMGVLSVTVLVIAAVLAQRQEAEDKARQWESVFNKASWAMALADPADDRLTAVTPAFAAMHGYTAEELLGRPLADVLTTESRRELPTHIQTAHQRGDYVYESVHVRKDVTQFPCLTHVTIVKDAHGKVERHAATFEDVTERKRAEAAVLEQEARLRAIVDHAVDGIITIDARGSIESFNPAAERLFGYRAEEVRGQNVKILMPEPYQSEHDGYLARYHRTGEAKIIGIGREVVGRRKNGSTFPLDLAVSEMRLGDRRLFTGITRDITERKRDEAHMKASLQEKDVLLKEIHHRVKNNLQIVSTLLDLQSEHTQDRQALEMFKESQGRVRSMALIHERLYRSQDLARVDFAEYVRSLADVLYRTYKVSGDEIVLDVDVHTHVPSLPLDIAIPCGLLLNELLSNCFKHAFKDAEQGNIRVTLHPSGADTSILTVADNGVGFPPGLDFRHTTSFGLQLVNILVEQLKGTIELGNNRETSLTITFPNRR